ncbi:MAG: thioredoxin [Ignavibacteriales bacterium]|nr:MAG: thioredoxin [Ignavibacteriales bacterium]
MLIKNYFSLFIIFLFLFVQVNGQDKIKNKTENKISNKPKVTFVELGSVNCIPCKKMQPIMKSIEERYGKQVKVVFHDVWKEDQKHYGEKYRIKLIPTQVFLDENGKEFFRHEGFYPEAEIDKLLEKRGVKAKENK